MFVPDIIHHLLNNVDTQTPRSDLIQIPRFDLRQINLTRLIFNRNLQARCRIRAVILRSSNPANAPQRDPDWPIRSPAVAVANHVADRLISSQRHLPAMLIRESDPRSDVIHQFPHPTQKQSVRFNLQPDVRWAIHGYVPSTLATIYLKVMIQNIELERLAHSQP